MTRRRVLVITTDPLTARMPGPSIRAWHLAEVLAGHHEVTLASAVACDRTHPEMDVRFADGPAMDELAAQAEVVVGPGSVVRRYPGIARSTTPLVVDIYDPYHLENLEPDAASTPDAHAANLRHLNAVVNEDLARGDLFLCASERQRDFWLGSLTAVGRVNPDTYGDDPTLGRLLTVVPFGLSADPPQRGGPGLRAQIDGIGPDDPVLVWGGGVYNWFDPSSLVRAVALARHRLPDLRLVFLGMRNPNPEIPEMAVAIAVRALADELGVTGTNVFFQDGWIPYEERADWLLDADVGVSTHLDHVETRFSFRTRVLDYLWADLPMVLTGGDALAQLVEDAGAGRTVPAGDVAAIADALCDLLGHPPAPGVVAALAARFHWSRVAAPLLAFCDDPRRAPDLLAAGSRMAETSTPDTHAPDTHAPDTPAAETPADTPPDSDAPPETPAPLVDVLRHEAGRMARGARRRLRAEIDRRRA